MKLLLVFLFLMLGAMEQGSPSGEAFEGIVHFKTEIGTTSLASESLPERLRAKYGTGIDMYYSKDGRFKRTHLNIASGQIESQFYLNDLGGLVFTYRDSDKLDTIDVSKNTLTLVSRERLPDETIISYDCECYQYDAHSLTAGAVILEFCFSKKTPWVSPENWTEHRDFFLDRFFAFAQRPYLRYALKTATFSLNMTAVSIEEKDLEAKTFRWN
ncbi:MAG: hypothetical protein ACFB10_09640 [Salibacteraceae bacterium]